jgi:gas vesicle protein
MKTMSSMLSNTIGTARTLVEGAYAANGLVKMLRRMDLDDGLAWVGLARRAGPLRVFAIFGAGLLVGAGAGLLFAPMRGVDTRRALLKQFKYAKDEAKETLDRAETEVKEIGKKAEEIAVSVVKPGSDTTTAKPSAEANRTLGTHEKSVPDNRHRVS